MSHGYRRDSTKKPDILEVPPSYPNTTTVVIQRYPRGIPEVPKRYLISTSEVPHRYQVTEYVPQGDRLLHFIVSTTRSMPEEGN